MSNQSCGGKTHFLCQSAGFQFFFSRDIRTNIYTQGTRRARWWRSFLFDPGKKGPWVPFFPVWVPVDEMVDTFPSHYQRPSKGPNFVNFLKSMRISPVKSTGGTMAILLPRWGNPVHTQVPWWSTVCLRCFRPRPLSLKSIIRCCDVSTRALAIAIPRNPERKVSE